MRDHLLLADLGFLGYWAVDFRTGVIDASHALQQLFQIYGTAESDDTKIDEYTIHVHPDDREWLARERPRSFGPSGRGVIEYRIIDGAGRVRWIMCRGIYETDVDGNLTRGHGMMIDVTEFKADGNSPRTAPAPLPNPVQSLVDASLDAFEAAKQFGDPNIIGLLGSVLESAGIMMGSSLSGPPKHRH